MPQFPQPGDDGIQLEGDFHHFQLINQDGDVPMSISVLVHVNTPAHAAAAAPALTADDVLALHNELERYNGDFITAFKRARRTKK
jgi:hypothetical protein